MPILCRVEDRGAASACKPRVRNEAALFPLPKDNFRFEIVFQHVEGNMILVFEHHGPTIAKGRYVRNTVTCVNEICGIAGTMIGTITESDLHRHQPSPRKAREIEYGTIR